MKKTIAAGLVLAVLVLGCGRMTPATPEPEPTLIGTWESEGAVLTFTASRWIRDDQGKLTNGLWEMTETELGLGLDTTSGYQLTDDTLLLDGTEYRRIEDPLPVSAIIGTWINTASVVPDDGRPYIELRTLTIEEDGGYHYSAARQFGEDEPILVFDVAARWEDDPAEKRLVLSPVWILTGPEFDIADTLYMGYAPMQDSPDRWVASMFWAEVGWEGVTEDTGGRYRRVWESPEAIG